MSTNQWCDFPLPATMPKLQSLQSELAELLRGSAGESEGIIKICRSELLFREGDPTDSLYIIESGEIRVFINNTAGHEITIAILSEGSIIGEMTLFGETRRSASCAAESEEASLLRFSNDVAARLIDTNPKLRHSLIRALIHRSRNMLSYIDEFSHLTQLVTSGNYGDVQSYINQSGDGGDKTIKAARAAFTEMFERVKQRENELQQKIQSLTIEIDHARAKREAEEISSGDGFLALLNKAESIRARSRS